MEPKKGSSEKIQKKRIPAIKGEGNKRQFLFTSNLETLVEEASDDLEKGIIDNVKGTLEKIRNQCEERKQLILMADNSEFGWKLANEFESLSSIVNGDETKARRIKEAEEAIRMKTEHKRRKDLQTDHRFGNFQTGNQHPYRFQQHHPDHFRQHNRQYDQNQQSIGYQENRRNYAEPNDMCYRCGKSGHWSSSCYVNLRREQDKCNTISLNSPITISKNSKDNTKGRLKQAISYWEYVEASDFILSTISEGYKIPFYSKPTPCHLKNNTSANDDHEFVSKELLKLLESGKIKKLTYKPTHVNPLSVATRNEKKRLILDLRHINLFVYKQSVKFEDWKTFTNFIERNGYAFTFDIKSGYHHVDIFPDHQIYLSFSWKFSEVEEFFCFTVLPFGLTSAPYLFTKLLRPLVKYWRKNGVKIAVFIDDGQSIDIDYEKCNKNSQLVRNSLAASGFLENSGKSEWEPKKHTRWLGVDLNLEENCLNIPDYRISSLISSLENAKNKEFMLSARDISKICGKIISMKVVIGNICQLMTRNMYREIESRQLWDNTTITTKGTKTEILFWLANLSDLNAKHLLDSFDPEVFAFSDASSVACGGFSIVNSQKHVAHKNWNEIEKQESSTWRELSAIEFCLQAFLPLIKYKTIFWNTDNQPTVAIIEKGSMVSKLQSIALSIFQICLKNSISIKINWIPREENTSADKISKIIDYNDWSLSKEFFEYIDQQWGPHTIDRFANHKNKKLNRFNSKFWCPGTEAVDAFSQNWSGENNWLVPPIHLISKTIRYIKTFQCKASLKVPLWESAPFWPLINKNASEQYSFVEKSYAFSEPNAFLHKGQYKNSLLGSSKFKSKLIPFKLNTLKPKS